MRETPVCCDGMLYIVEDAQRKLVDITDCDDVAEVMALNGYNVRSFVEVTDPIRDDTLPPKHAWATVLRWIVGAGAALLALLVALRNVLA